MVLRNPAHNIATILIAFTGVILHGGPGVANSLFSDDCDGLLSGQWIFENTESVCVSGDMDYASPLHPVFPSSLVFVVQNREWQNGDPLVDHYGNATVIVGSLAGGAFISELLQPPFLDPGEYDLVLDENANAVYDLGYDRVVGEGLDYSFLVIEDSPLVFHDDFESGDTSAWSVTVP